MAERLHHTPKKNGKNIKKFVDDVQKKQEKQINNMIKYYKRTPLVYNQDLRNILDTARNQIIGIPSYVQFSRKIFIYKF